MIKKTIVWLAILLCGTSVSKTPEYGYVEIYDKGEISEIEFNDEVVATIKSDNGKISCYIFAYSIKNEQLSMAVKVYEEDKRRHYTIMYIINLKNKTIVKEERLAENTYKDSDFEFSITLDTNSRRATIIRYTRKGKKHEVLLPIEKSYATSATYYISKNGHIVIHDDDRLYVFSADKKKFTDLGEVSYNNIPGFINFDFEYGWYIPFNEYVIYSPEHTNKHNMTVYLYRYAEDALYATRYKKTSLIAKDTIERNIKNGNIYEQFLPLTRIKNIDSIAKYNRSQMEWEKYLAEEENEKEPELPEKSKAAEAVEGELGLLESEYALRFNVWSYGCKQCSNLEKLLVLERALRADIYYYYRSKDIKDIPYFKKGKAIKNYFTELVDSNDYSWTSLFLTKIDYELGKAISAYEMWFNREPPSCPENTKKGYICSRQKATEYLMRAIEADSPYLTDDEETNLKAEYQKRFGKPMTDLEFSTMGVYFRIRESEIHPYISVSRTATGAIARYVPSIKAQIYIEPLEVELGMEEWLDFVKVLHECQVDEWEKIYGVSEGFKGEWEFKIFFSDRDKIEYSGIKNAYPPNWERFIKIMDDMKARIKKDAVVEVIEEPQGYSKNNF